MTKFSNDDRPVVVIGAGLIGMAIGTMLAQHGLPVVIIERDPREAFGRPEEYPRLRPGAPHASRPHNLLAGGRDILHQSLPQVAERMYTLGARNAVEHPGSVIEYGLTAVALRRTLLEQAFLAVADDLPSLVIRFGESVRTLVLEGGQLRRVTGVETSRVSQPAELVIDASGVNGKILRTLPVTSVSHIGLKSRSYYSSQPLRLSPQGFDAAMGGLSVRIDLPLARVEEARIFFHDPPYASILVSQHADKGPPDRELTFRAYREVLSSIRLYKYLRDAIPLAPVQIMGYLKSVIQLPDYSFLDVEGVHQIGDALATIHPLTSRGMTLGLIEAAALAQAIVVDISNYRSQRDALRRVYYEWVMPNWANGLIVGGYVRPGLRPPAEIDDCVRIAQDRWWKTRALRTARQEARPGDSGQAELISRIAMLQLPQSAIDRLASAPPVGGGC